MFLNDDNVGAERISSGRLFQATSHTKCPVDEMQPCPGYQQIATSSGTKNRKVGNSRNWDAQFVEITWCQAVDCLVHQQADDRGVVKSHDSNCRQHLCALSVCLSVIFVSSVCVCVCVCIPVSHVLSTCCDIYYRVLVIKSYRNER